MFLPFSLTDRRPEAEKMCSRLRCPLSSVAQPVLLVAATRMSARAVRMLNAQCLTTAERRWSAGDGVQEFTNAGPLGAGARLYRIGAEN
jgi:hypothetical protein